MTWPRTAHDRPRRPISTRAARELRAGILNARHLHGMFGMRGRLLTAEERLPAPYRRAFNRTAHLLAVREAFGW
ncbi:hypothetical protein HQQ88_08180 [Curtobacterium sp. VKM Ac-2861]|uniref:hypothetical protein n=1 Tax=Curtobacterium sp. VKM Ac-2861 TaxID=2739016 RepID=UPI001563C28C|nr:hypothetical protein [Curtobacterium sp. VKM Ac-2861]